MKSPFTGKEMTIQKEERILKFRKDEFRVLFHSYKCVDTGDNFEDDIFSQLNYNQLVNQYRVRYSIPFPEQIIEIRKKYELSTVKMSELLGFGVNSYRNYEGGEVPKSSNAKLIQLAGNPFEFKKIVQLCNSYEQKAKEKLLHKIDLMRAEVKRTKFEKQFENYLLGPLTPTILTGYKIPSFAKFKEMIVFFVEKHLPWKTQLNKLLFYADFGRFEQVGFSISGIQYRAIPLGPVPNNFNSIFDYLARNDEFDINSVRFSHGIGEQFTPRQDRVFNSDLFTLDELEVLEAVSKRFERVSTKQIVDISHKERAWIENKDEKKLIDYNYSFEMNN